MRQNDIEKISSDFLSFSFFFHQFSKNRYQKDCKIKAHSLAFHALMLLQNVNQQPLTMSQLAKQMDITKQQLTRLVNMLEEQRMVERIHDQHNRRQVYVQITEEGRSVIIMLCQELLSNITRSLSVLSDEELLELHQCTSTLTQILEKLA